VLELSYGSELRQDEIAHLLDIPVGTVKSRTHNALRSLKSIMEQRRLPPDESPAGPIRHPGTRVGGSSPATKTVVSALPGSAAVRSPGAAWIPDQRGAAA
jgi:hypothetical protein